MIADYPYFGLPNYTRYIHPNIYQSQDSNTLNKISNNLSHVKPYNINLNNNYYEKFTNRDFNNKESNYFTPNHQQIKSKYNSNTYNYNAHNPNFSSNNNTNSIKNNYISNNFSNKSYSKENKINTNSDFEESSSPLFSILGINLFFDDILILCILFFLYNENVNDPFLYIILILLLLT